MSKPMAPGLIDQHIREVFRNECSAILKVSGEDIRSSDESLRLLPGFAEHYRSLRALPRRKRRLLERHWKRGLGAIALLMTLGQAPAWAASISISAGTPPPVNNDGRCSLVEAIINANNDSSTHSDCASGAGPDTILLPSKSTQQIAEPLPGITSSILIEGRGSTIIRETSSDPYMDWMLRTGVTGELTLNRTTVSGAGGARAGVLNEGGVVTLQSSVIQDVGRDLVAYPSYYARGGGGFGLVNIGGTVRLDGSTVSDSGVNGNRFLVGGGGGISNRDGGTLTLVNSDVLRNQVFGINNEPDSTATLIHSVVSQNRTYIGSAGFPSGGGIRNEGELTLIRSTVSQNLADSGGGIGNFGTATLIRSTVSGNSAGGYGGRGGGIETFGLLRLFNSTVSGNVARYYGGGIHISFSSYLTDTIVLANSTVTRNRAQRDGGGLYTQNSVTVWRSIVAGNRVDDPSPGTREIGGTGVITANSFNLFGHDGDAGTGASFSPGPTDIVPDVSIDAILMPLARNGGGRLWTHALAIGSPALDASPDDRNCPAIDQRGNPRPQGAACDIGAFEGSAVQCNGIVTTMVGTTQGDFLKGTPRRDVIHALGGDDMITGLEGDDVVCAGGGSDIVWGGMGTDVGVGEGGDDVLFGNAGRDQLDGGGGGTDRCNGGQPNSAPGDTAVNCEIIEQVP